MIIKTSPENDPPVFPNLRRLDMIQPTEPVAAILHSALCLCWVAEQVRFVSLKLAVVYV
jgi:hypothetical protein